MSASDFFLGRQPILNNKHTIAAYELLFRRANSDGAGVLDDLHATASVIINAFSELNLTAVLGGKPAFINVNAEILLSGMIEILPKQLVVLELLETIEITAEIVQRCQALKAAGFTLALDDVEDYAESYQPLLDCISIVKLDLKQIDSRRLQQLVTAFRRHPVKLLAEKVDTPEEADYCRQLGFDLFQGYYYARPVVLSGKRADPNKLSLLRLLGLLLGDAETTEIEQVFRINPDLTYSLMRLVNSSACGLPTPIHSVHQAIVVLGRKQLMRWLQLLMFASHDRQNSQPSPLMQLAATRARLMELLAPVITGINPDEAFMVGLLSLLDSLMGMPLAEILTELKLSDAARAALLYSTGGLGDLLALAKALEEADFQRVDQLVGAYPALAGGILTKAEIAASEWVHQLSSGNL